MQKALASPVAGRHFLFHRRNQAFLHSWVLLSPRELPGLLCLLPGLGSLQASGTAFSHPAPSFPAAKMPLPWTVTAGPELQSPKEPGKPQTLAQGTRKSNSMKEPSIHHGDTLKPSLSTLKRTFFRTSLPASTHKPKEDQGLIRRSSRLFRSLRRALDEGLAAGHPQVPAVTEKPSSVTDGISRQASTGMGPEDLELQEGRVSYNSVRGN